jgi:hypothetical protein
LLFRSEGSETLGHSNGGDSKSLIGAPSLHPDILQPDNIQSGVNGFTIGIVTGTGDGHSDPSKYSSGRGPRHQSTTTSYAYSRQSRPDGTGETFVGYVDLGRMEETTKKFSKRYKNIRNGGGDDGGDGDKHGNREPRERDQRNKDMRDRGESKEKGEVREKGSARTRDRPVTLKVAQSTYNLESDFPNLVRTRPSSRAAQTIVYILLNRRCVLLMQMLVTKSQYLYTFIFYVLRQPELEHFLKMSVLFFHPLNG